MRIYLHELPIDHELRTKPLVGAFYHNKNGKVSREVFSTYGIAKKCYNDLGSAWIDAELFYFEVENENHQ